MKINLENEVYLKKIIKIEPDEEEIKKLSDVLVVYGFEEKGYAKPHRLSLSLEGEDMETLRLIETIVNEIVEKARESDGD